MTSSRSPVSGRSDASWCGRGLRGPSSFTGRPSDGGGAGLGPWRLLFIVAQSSSKLAVVFYK